MKCFIFLGILTVFCFYVEQVIEFFSGNTCIIRHNVTKIVIHILFPFYPREKFFFSERKETVLNK